ncbi:hypothetical protein BSKO_11071 [Bryopsis sp. KO-2023]|nr:hypothetical protein BSKO_11071 [Bryopsis sp. KO-2023]
MIEKDGRGSPNSDNSHDEGGEGATQTGKGRSAVSLPELRIAWKTSEGRDPKKECNSLLRHHNKADVSPAFVVSVVGSGALCFAVGSEALYPYFAGGFVLEGVVRLMKRDKILLSVCWSLGLFTASLVILARRRGKSVAVSDGRVNGNGLDLGAAMRKGRNMTILSMGGYLLALGLASFSLVQNGELPMMW